MIQLYVIVLQQNALSVTMSGYVASFALCCVCKLHIHLLLMHRAGVTTEVLDVLDKTAIEAILKKYTNIDVVFNCAG